MALLKLAVDDLISQIDVAHSNTVKGVGTQDGALCYGVQFLPAEDGGFVVNNFTDRFEPRKVWKGEVDQWQFDGCGDSGEMVAKTLVLDGAVVVEELALDGSEISSELAFRFVPPEGSVELAVGAGSFGPAAQELSVTLRFGGGESARRATFVYNFESLTASDE